MAEQRREEPLGAQRVEKFHPQAEVFAGSPPRGEKNASWEGQRLKMPLVSVLITTFYILISKYVGLLAQMAYDLRTPFCIFDFGRNL